MPKKPFNFDVTGRELFDSERSAVNGFVRRYASSSTAAREPSVDVKHTRTIAKDAASGRFVDREKSVVRPKAGGGWAVKKAAASTLSTQERKAVIFGMTERPQAQSGDTKSRRPSEKAVAPRSSATGKR